MAKAKNQKIYCTTTDEFHRVADELRTYIGRDFISNPNTLEITVLAYPRYYKKKAKKEAKLRTQRRNRDNGYNISTADGDYRDAARRYNR